jgi:TRAP-type C4-dicarboxylate transport system substrate-binding protein
MKKLIWLIAHEPQHLFVRTAKAFSKKLAELTNGDFEIEMLTDAEYREKYSPGFQEKTDLFPHLKQNKVQMSQTQVHRFAPWDVNYRVFDMPFLFRDHDHATKVFEGEIGQSFGHRLAKVSGMRGLAFTYSGGFRLIGSNKPIESVNELAGLRVRVNGNPVNFDFINQLGAQALPMYTSGYDNIVDGQLDAAETTYIRFLGKHVLETSHNLFLTTIVVNDTFWSSLSETEQLAFNEAAVESARLERQWSIDDAAEFNKNCVANGVTITKISEEQKTQLQNASLPVYEKWEQYFHPGLIESIRQVH